MRVVYDRFKPVVKTQKNVTRDVRHAVLWYCGTFIATGDAPDILFGTENWYYHCSTSGVVRRHQGRRICSALNRIVDALTMVSLKSLLMQ